MKTKQAKDFLVQQTTEQAILGNMALSDIEKKMMYFTESDATSCDNPVELNDEFEAQCDTTEYEAKISRLLHHAYNRLKAEDPERKRSWDQAIRTLRNGDHYILVLWDVKPPSEQPPSEHSGRDSLRLLGAGMLVLQFSRHKRQPRIITKGSSATLLAFTCSLSSLACRMHCTRKAKFQVGWFSARWLLYFDG